MNRFITIDRKINGNNYALTMGDKSEESNPAEKWRTKLKKEKKKGNPEFNKE